MMEKNFTVDNDTFASNPGNANLNPFIWFIHNYQIVSILGASFIISLFLVFKISLWFIIILSLSLIINIFYWLRKKEHFKSGDSNGGLVISINPKLVAITTDLTKGFGHYPVVKIIHYKTSKKIKIGDKIATVALYSSSTDDSLPHWIDFHPIPLSYATKNKSTHQSAINSYESTQWEDLEKRLTEIDKPYKIGLYKVDVKNSDWN